MKIVLKNLSKEFKNEKVLDDINVTFEDANIIGLLGRNGSGKSVLMKIIAGFYIPTSGEVLVDNVNFIKENKFCPDTRVLIEKPTFLPELTGFENLKLLASIQNKIGNNEIENALKSVNLFQEKDKKYSKYSLGMKQKLGIAQVIMEDPKIMILDEPFNGIESETVKKLKELFISMKKEGKLILMCSHIKDDLLEICDVIYEIDAGKLKPYEK